MFLFDPVQPSPKSAKGKMFSAAKCYFWYLQPLLGSKRKQLKARKKERNMNAWRAIRRRPVTDNMMA